MREAAIPDVTSEVLGYRKWLFTWPSGLRGLYVDSRWDADNTAVCNDSYRPDGIHCERNAPCRIETGCGSGLYGFHTLERARKEMSYTLSLTVLGAVAARGRVTVYHDGWRAEHVKILALERGQGLTHDVLTRVVGHQLRVPVIEPGDIERFALDRARPLDPHVFLP